MLSVEATSGLVHVQRLNHIISVCEFGGPIIVTMTSNCPAIFSKILHEIGTRFGPLTTEFPRCSNNTCRKQVLDFGKIGIVCTRCFSVSRGNKQQHLRHTRMAVLKNREIFLQRLTECLKNRGYSRVLGDDRSTILFSRIYENYEYKIDTVV